MKGIRALSIVAASAALTLSLTAAENPEFLKVKAVLAAKYNGLLGKNYHTGFGHLPSQPLRLGFTWVNGGPIKPFSY